MNRFSRSITFFTILIAIFIVPLIYSGCGVGGEQTSDNQAIDEVASTNRTSLELSKSNSKSLISSSDFDVEFSVTSDWGSGFVSDIMVKNSGQEEIKEWRLEFDFDHNITGIWNARIIEHQGNHYVIEGESYNSGISPGGMVSFGFQGMPGNVSVNPANYILSGDTPTPTPPEDDEYTNGDVTITYKTVNDWGSGFTGEITVKNNGSQDIKDWAVEFDFNHDITSIWNALVSSHTGSHFNITPETYNGTISPGGSVSFGFVGSPGNVTQGPSSMVLSGVLPQPTPTPTPEPTQTPEPTPSPEPTQEPTPTPTVSPSPTPEPTQEPTPTPTPPSGDKRIVAYFVNWGIYGRNYNVTDIPADKITHINYAFFAIDSATKTVKMIDTWADIEKVFTGDEDKGFPDQTWDQSARGEAGNLGRLKQLKALYPHIKTQMSIGGWTLSYNFPDIARTQEARQTFVSSCVAMMTKYDFDGIDIDWEYPGAADKVNCTLLMQEFRTQLDEQGQIDGKQYLLSMAGPAGHDKLANMELDKLANSLDFLNIMTYDFHGGWDSSTNHHSPLYLNPNDPINPIDREYLNNDWTINYYINAGMPPEKLSMGIPFYGRAWEEVSDVNNGLFQAGPSLPNTGISGNWEPGYIDYWGIQELLSDTANYTVYRDEHAKVPWVYGKNLTSSKTNGGMFVTFEDPISVTNKMKYLKDNNLGGVMFWELSGDVRDINDPRSLLRAIYSEIGR
ncbi:MAG: cellulose binding domain-containing protein [Candidatus Eremiobacteraeota bacterium]|nr:cellulose binding domain-containing protein [Candidatus Eremiobacteraeota bacterium]